MLLNFKVSNYKSFIDEVDFKMEAKDSISGHEYSLIKEKFGNKVKKGLSTAVIYGPNASGKTNIIGALEVFKSIVERGHINNVGENVITPNMAKNNLEMIPNLKAVNKPVVFSILFTAQEHIFNFYLEAEFGNFMEENAKRRIIREYLYVDEKMIYDRREKNFVFDTKPIAKFVNSGFSKEFTTSLISENLFDNELILNTQFKTLISSKIVDIIMTWFKEELTVIFSADKLRSRPVLSEGKSAKDLFINTVLNEVAKEFGMTSNALAFSSKDNSNNDLELYSLIENEGEKNIAISAEIFESFGTIRFMNLFPVIIDAFIKGSTLVVDEFDASIHPNALMSIIGLFHNDEINTNGAQLIFNTHNPLFLSHNLLRRDEIKFIERDEETGNSVHYSLADFGTSGKHGVRKTENYLNGYFLSKYGAIKHVDFTDVFESVMRKVGESNENKA